MVEFLLKHQLNIMLALSSVCGTIALFVLIARALPKKRRVALLLLELSSMFLLYFDRLAYIYSGDVSDTGYVMVRVSNFLVFFLTNIVVLSFNLYLIDVIKGAGGLEGVAFRLNLCVILSLVGSALVVVSNFTGMYYYFDEFNNYNRGPLFILCYVFPVVTPLIQLSVILQKKDRITKGIYISLVLFIIVPIFASIIQIFAYGLSLTNIFIVGMAVLVYIFALFDINNKIEKANRREIEYLKEERQVMQRLFDQTASSFVNAVDSKDDFTKGHSLRVAKYAKLIAQTCGKNEKECDEIYYTALLHDIGKVGIPESVLEKGEDRTPEEQEIYKTVTTIGDEILSNINEYPYLRDGAHFVHERYDGKGYPVGLKGEEIPENARIIAVADNYDLLTSKKRDRDHYPQFMVREEMVKAAGTRFDPRFAGAMVSIIDSDVDYRLRESFGDEFEVKLETELTCEAYRSKVSRGILIDETITKIDFDYEAGKGSPFGFFGPSIIVFDSYDGRIHNDVKNIEVFGYMEYGEIWFDGNCNSTNARNIEVTVTDLQSSTNKNVPHYEIMTSRYEDHVKITIIGEGKKIDIVMALPDTSKYAYVGLTGEYCNLKNIEVETSEDSNVQIPIERIAPVVSYINRLESDLPNIQIDRNRSVYTEPVSVEDGMNVIFHSMSLPAAKLVWHCPYVLLYYSDDGRVDGANYREYALVKLSGENDCDTIYAENSMTNNQSSEFVDWDTWEMKNKEGVECHISFRKKKNSIEIAAEDAGIIIRNTTRIKEMPKVVYFALTGDECAITDIRIYK
ncbi:MAG: HD domain-containing protein [Pseudobutyrivibrio sp.]|nr:HD domain-containing protein [Pseudobutyrivibrio sp.]